MTKEATGEDRDPDRVGHLIFGEGEVGFFLRKSSDFDMPGRCYKHLRFFLKGNKWARPEESAQWWTTSSGWMGDAEHLSPEEWTR